MRCFPLRVPLPWKGIELALTEWFGSVGPAI